MRKISVRSLPMIRANGIDFHVSQVNINLSYDKDSLRCISSYLEKQKHLKPQSLRVIAFGLKKALLIALGIKAHDSQRRVIIDSAFAKYTKLRTNPTARRLIPIEDIMECIEKSGARTSAFFEFLFLSGCRISETCQIRKEDITKNENHCEILIHGKGKRDRFILMPTATIERIRKIFHGRIYLFETAKQRPYGRKTAAWLMRDASNRILGYGVQPHDMRRAFATYMATNHPSHLKAILNHGGWASADVFFKHYVKQRLAPELLPQLKFQRTGWIKIKRRAG